MRTLSILPTKMILEQGYLCGKHTRSCSTNGQDNIMREWLYKELLSHEVFRKLKKK